jgi:hypothetical protein
MSGTRHLTHARDNHVCSSRIDPHNAIVLGDGPKCFDGFYSWACMMQWWEKQMAPLRKQLSDLGRDGLANKVTEYGRKLPCVTMPLDLKATSHMWLGAVDDRSVIRSAASIGSA